MNNKMGKLLKEGYGIECKVRTYADNESYRRSFEQFPVSVYVSCE